MDPVYRRAPHNELPLEQLDHASDSNARAQAAHACLTPGAAAPLRVAGSFRQCLVTVVVTDAELFAALVFGVLALTLAVSVTERARRTPCRVQRQWSGGPDVPGCSP
jgi:hypothetical protein